MAVSIQQVADEAGVSIATVSRILNGKPYVRKDVQDKVLSTAHRLNYTPKARAGTMRIPLLIESYGRKGLGIYGSIMIAQITELLAESSCHLELVQIENHESLKEQFAKAALVLSYSSRAAEILSKCETPLVSINNPVEGALNIYSDHFRDGYMSAELLVKAGHRRIGACISHIDGWGRNDRLNGFKTALDDHGVPFDSLLYGDDVNDLSFLAPVTGIIRHGATALAALGHEVGLHVAHSLFMLGKRVPEDISLVSTENQFFSQFAVPPQTSVAQPVSEMAELAVREAVAIAAGNKFKGRDIIFDNTVINRGSVRNIA